MDTMQAKLEFSPLYEIWAKSIIYQAENKDTPDNRLDLLGAGDDKAGSMGDQALL